MEKKKKSMKLRTRVIISFFIIILVPIVMCALTFYFFVGYKAKIIGEKYGLANATYRTISNNTLLLNAMTSEEYDEVEDTAKSDTAKLEETNYLSVLNARLQKKQSFIAVCEDGVIIYNGSEELSSEELENELPKYGDPGANSKGGVYFRNEKQWMVKQVDYENSDGKECSAFIVTKTDQIAPQITGMVKELGIVIVLILVLTSLGLSFWIYRGVIGPLEQLKKATQNIKDGNLDFTVEPCGVAEINDLCEDFEEMRIRLKETAEEKVEFDKENKELISNISHDLKTPITAVKGYVEGIMDGVANTPEKMDRYIRTIYNKANEMDRLINELTFYSKIDTNRIPYTFSKIHIADYFDDCVEELNLEDPEIVRQGGRYGVRMRASAPSIHLIRADIETTVSPIVGNEKQSEDMVNYLLQEFEGDTGKLWQSNIFGRSFHEIVGEDLQAKLKRMPADAQAKLRQALERIINEGGGGLICIIL